MTLAPRRSVGGHEVCALPGTRLTQFGAVLVKELGQRTGGAAGAADLQAVTRLGW